MKLSTLIYIGAGALCVPFLSQAQTTQPAFGYYNDILDYTQNDLFGSARMQGIGGAKTALGADLSSAVVNPAGLGFFNRTTASISPTLYTKSNEATYLDQRSSDFAAPFGLATFGVSFNSEMDGPSGDWRGGNLAITHTRLNTYRNKITYEGNLYNLDSYSDFTGYAIDEMNAFGENGSSNLAYSAYLNYLVVGPDEGFPDYTSYVNVPSDLQPTHQREVLDISGRKNTFNIAYGANYRDKLYLGAGIGFVSTERRINRTFTETPFANDTLPLIETIIDEDINQSGDGYYVNAGIIYRPVSFVMVGASIESSTLLNLDETFNQFVTNSWRSNYPIPEAAGQTLESGVSSENPFEFTAITPMRVRGGATVFLGKSGFIAADVEYLDYQRMRLRAESSLTGDNQVIEALYGSAFNYSIGGEFRLDELYFRGGYAHRGEPLSNPIAAISRAANYFTAGAGLRRENFFVDLAYVYGTTQTEYNRYAGGAFADVDLRQNRISLTTGVNF